MLDQIDRRRVLEQPAREGFHPDKRLRGIGALFNEHLNESANLGRIFPRQRFLAGRQLDKHIADAPRFAAFQHNVLFNIVAFVEQSEPCHAVFHRGAELAFHRRAAACAGGNADRNLGGLGFDHFVSLPVASSQSSRADSQKGDCPFQSGARFIASPASSHQTSGDQAS